VPKLTGKETITYHNQSPDKLDYLWLQLDQNIFEPGSDANMIRTGTIGDSVSLRAGGKWVQPFEGGYKITGVTDAARRQAEVHHQQDDDAHRPAQAAGARCHVHPSRSNGGTGSTTA
jgi:hypothetical protein